MDAAQISSGTGLLLAFPAHAKTAARFIPYLRIHSICDQRYT